MRDYVLHQAEFRDKAFAFPRLRRVVRNWFARRSLARLETMDDHILWDIGLTRDDLRHGRGLPLDVDPIAEIIRGRESRFSRGVRHK